MPQFQLQSRNLGGRGNQRREKLEKKLINSIIDFWNKDVIAPIRENKEMTDLAATTRQIINSLHTELVNRVEDHVKGIIKLGLFDDDSTSGASTQIVNELYQQFLQDTQLQNAVTRLSQRMSSKMLTVSQISDAMGNLKDELPSILEKIADRELQKFEAVVRSDSQYAIHLGREADWKSRDPEGEYRYRWGSANDSRRTECCEEITRIAKEEARKNGEKGVTLERLKKIVYEQGRKYYPEYRQKPWNPHWGCRSGAERVV